MSEEGFVCTSLVLGHTATPWQRANHTMKSQTEENGFCGIRTGVNSGEVSRWMASETTRGRLCWEPKSGNQRRNDWHQWKQVIEGFFFFLGRRATWPGGQVHNVTNAVNETWWVAPNEEAQVKSRLCDYNLNWLVLKCLAKCCLAVFGPQLRNLLNSRQCPVRCPLPVT